MFLLFSILKHVMVTLLTGVCVHVYLYYMCTCACDQWKREKGCSFCVCEMSIYKLHSLKQAQSEVHLVTVIRTKNDVVIKILPCKIYTVCTCKICHFVAVQLDQFHNLLENQQLTLEEQDKAFENIRTDHEKLRRSYLQAKEDYNVLRRSGIVCVVLTLTPVQGILMFWSLAEGAKLAKEKKDK